MGRRGPLTAIVRSAPLSTEAGRGETIQLSGSAPQVSFASGWGSQNGLGRCLSFLKYASFIIVALSGVWALVAKTSFEDEQGRKRLTAAGHVSVAIVIASALVGMLAFGFETLAKQEAQGAEDDKQARLELKQEGIRDIEQGRVKAQRALDAQGVQAREASRRADAAEQRLLSLEAAAEQRETGRNIRQDVSRGAADNLARTQAALRQLERVLNPITSPRVEIVWSCAGHAGCGALSRACGIRRTPRRVSLLSEGTPGVSRLGVRASGASSASHSMRILRCSRARIRTPPCGPSHAIMWKSAFPGCGQRATCAVKNTTGARATEAGLPRKRW